MSPNPQRRGLRIGLSLFALAISFGLLGTSAAAQELPEDTGTTFQEAPRENEPIPVAQRPQPLYDAPGIPVGPFRLFPQTEIGAIYNSNVLTLASDSADDIGVLISPRLDARANWSGGNLNIYLRSRIEAYARQETENTEQVWGGFNARLDVRRSTRIHIAAEAGTFVEDRTSNLTPPGSREPIEFDRAFATVRVDTQAGRVNAQIGLEVDSLWFRNANSRTNPSVVIVQTTRDRVRVEPNLLLTYEMGYSSAVFGGVSYNSRDYRTELLQDRDSTGGDAFLGIRFRLTPLVRARIAAGLIWQNYQAPLQDLNGLYLEAQLDWFVTELTTLTGSLRRDIAESGSVLTGGAITTRGHLRIDHELLRNMILSAQAGLELYDFSDIDRLDRRYRMSLTARYRSSPRLEFNARFEYLRQASSGLLSTLDFGQARIMLSAIGRW
jgi:hypothetical protein